MTNIFNRLAFLLALAAAKIDLTTAAPTGGGSLGVHVQRRQTTTTPTEGGFLTTGGCSPNWVLGFGGYPQFVAAECPDPWGNKHASFISLMDCVTNNEGVLEAKAGGSALYSCSSCMREEGSKSNISCLCQRTWGAPSWTTIDLNTVIRNEKGILACFDYWGVEVKSMNDPPA